MEKTIEELEKIISISREKLQHLNKDDWNYHKAPGKWNKKEILGHLIDSAANNHQRFVRVQYIENLNFFYDQNIWVAKQNYKDADVDILINLWYYSNVHLLYSVKNIKKESLQNTVVINNKNVSLEWVVKDYLRHLKHHLNQIIYI